MSVSVEKATGMKKLVDRAKGYGMPGVNVDGNDVKIVYLETSKAIQRARAGNGPTLIESMVHRWTGHSISDADIYRTDEERKKGEKKDPIKRIKRELIKESILTESTWQKIEKRVEEEIEAAVNYSEKECTIPDPAEILRGVYADS
jgi:TPP-dependent pyruvate/acetoin dehydrogenase alpha subunit